MRPFHRPVAGILASREESVIKLPKATRADVALLLEGTYPYISGGVSSWVHQLVQGFPEYRFACIFLGSRQEDYGDMRYPLPANVVHVETHYLHDPNGVPEPLAMAGDGKAMEKVSDFHDLLRRAAGPAEGGEDLVAKLASLIAESGIDEQQFLYSKAAWSFITERYRRHCTDPSFVDYFWTVRSMHQPIWRLHRIARSMIPVSFYHTASTGYAGFLGTLLKQRNGRPLLLSEHGIYTKERKIDLLQSDWLVDNRDVFQMDSTEISYFRELWIRFFGSLGQMCYEAADQVVALFETNRQRQIEDGATAARTVSIPNGIPIERFAPIRTERSGPPPRVLCLVGRVVPIKDVKTFIRAMRIVVNHDAAAEGWIAGPVDEDPEYVRECRALAASLGLKDKVRFLGFQKMEALLPKVGLIVLSSISEGLPLVLLESMAAGVPAVVTDVGACRGLIEGVGEEDQSIGRCGNVVRIADPAALGKAALEFLHDEARWWAASDAGFRRVSSYYQDRQMLDAYRALYRRMATSSGQAQSTGTGCPYRSESASVPCPARQGG
jgi:polysaccharide biosynthesis protein PelF